MREYEIISDSGTEAVKTYCLIYGCPERYVKEHCIVRLKKMKGKDMTCNECIHCSEIERLNGIIDTMVDEQMNFYCSFTQSKIQNCPIDDEVAKAKADTVRKMQSEIEARCIKGGIYPAFVKSTIDQIAKEMIEGETK